MPASMNASLQVRETYNFQSVRQLPASWVPPVHHMLDGKGLSGYLCDRTWVNGVLAKCSQAYLFHSILADSLQTALVQLSWTPLLLLLSINTKG